MPREVGGAQPRDHLLRQHRLCYAYGLPVHYHGGVDCYTLLGKIFLKLKFCRRINDWNNPELVHVVEYGLYLPATREETRLPQYGYTRVVNDDGLIVEVIAIVVERFQF